MRGLGRYSYGIYVFHWPLLMFTGTGVASVAARVLRIGGSTLPGLIVYWSVSAAIAVAVAFASYHLYEKHFLRLKARLAPIARENRQSQLLARADAAPIDPVFSDRA